MKIKSEKSWIRSGNKLFLVEEGSKDTIKNIIYRVGFDENRNTLYLEEYGEKFEFPFKIYGLEEKFINHALKTFNNTSSNFGVLLNGPQGTGKTIVAKILANKLNQPIILIDRAFPDLNVFIADIKKDCTILIDEYEKVYTSATSYSNDDDEENNPKGNGALLTLMDGIWNSEYRRAFILTTNKKYINEYMINRPGRLRYVKEFKDLKRPQIEEILDDLLENKEFREDIISFLKPCELITVDIVKAVISEVNIHECSPFECCIDLNIKEKENKWQLVSGTGKNKKVIVKGINDYAVKRFEGLALSDNWTNATLDGETDNSYYINVYLTGKASVPNKYEVKDNMGITHMNARIEKEEFIHSSFVF